eukprot:g35502.t1
MSSPVSKWLVTHDLEHYVTLFEENGFEKLLDLENITWEDMEAMGVKLGHRRRILALLAVPRVTEEKINIPPLPDAGGLHGVHQWPPDQSLWANSSSSSSSSSSSPPPPLRSQRKSDATSLPRLTPHASHVESTGLESLIKETEEEQILARASSLSFSYSSFSRDALDGEDVKHDGGSAPETKDAVNSLSLPGYMSERRDSIPLNLTLYSQERISLTESTAPMESSDPASPLQPAVSALSDEGDIKERMRKKVSYAGRWLCADPSTGSPVRSKQEMAKLLFGNLECLLGMHDKLLSELEQASDEGKCLGEVFQDYIPHFKMYSDYVETNLRQSELLRNLRKNRTFNYAFLNAQRKFGDLNSLLINPIQRLPRYEMLFAQLKQNTPESKESPEYALVSKALEDIKKVNQDVNNSIKVRSEQQLIFDIQRRIKLNRFKAVKLGCKLVKQGQVNISEKDKKWLPYHVYLFNDVLLCLNWKIFAICQYRIQIHLHLSPKIDIYFKLLHVHDWQSWLHALMGTILQGRDRKDKIKAAMRQTNHQAEEKGEKAGAATARSDYSVPAGLACIVEMPILIMGPCASGKDSILRRYFENDFWESTPGLQFIRYETKQLVYKSVQVKLHVWAHTDKGSFREHGKWYLERAYKSGPLLIVYDITEKIWSLANFVKPIKDKLKELMDQGHTIMLVGNKCDKATTKRQVSLEEVQSYAKSIGDDVLVEEASAKTGENVESIFTKVVQLVLGKAFWQAFC